MDIQTVSLMSALVNTLLAIVLVVQYRFSPGRPGLGWWALGQTCLAVGMAVGNLRGASFLGHLVIPVYHVLLVAPTFLIYVGIRSFFGKPARWAPIVAVLCVLFVNATFFSLVIDDRTERTVVLYLAGAIGFAMAAVAAIRDRTPDVMRPALFLGSVLGATAAWYVVAAVAQALEPAPNDVFSASPAISAGFVIATAGTVLWTFGMVLLLNQRLAAEVRSEVAHLRTVFGAIPDCVVISRLRDGGVTDVNPGFSQLSGYTQEEAVGGFRATALWADPEGRERMVSVLLKTGMCQDMRVRLRRKDGSDVECMLNARVLDTDTEPHVVTVTRDITNDLALQEQLRVEATTDELTGMANRRHFLALADAAIAEGRDNWGDLAVAMLDLDGLKEINDTLGHRYGDAAISSFSDAIATGLPQVAPPQCLLERCVLGRLGGDEFGLLLPGINAAACFDVVESLLHVVANAPVVLDQRSITLTFSAGVGEYAGAEDSVDAMLARADSAMYQAKRQGRNQVVQAPPSVPPAVVDGAVTPGP